MKRFTIIIVSIGFFATLLMLAPLTTAQQTGTSQSDVDQIKQLQKERITVLSQVVQIMTRSYEQGVQNADFRQVISAQTELINAQLDATDNLKERIALLEDLSKLIKTLLDLAEQRVHVATSSEVDMLSIKSLYLKSQIDLLKERLKLKAAKDPNQ
jgi:outer membrane protein TolC